MTHTRNPKAYVTGGQVMRARAMDHCDLAAIPDDCTWPNAINGGPIDAPDTIPTGRISVSHGHLFFELAQRS
jgi:hypothetical protein